MLAKAEQPDEDGFITVVSKRPKVFEPEAPITAKEPTETCKAPANFYQWTGRQQEQLRAQRTPRSHHRQCQ